MSARRIARITLNVDRWYSAIASSGPTSAIDSQGERSQSTTSISAADDIRANGAVVCRMFAQARPKNGRPESAASTALIRTRLTTQL